jgi:hypothetical protein
MLTCLLNRVFAVHFTPITRMSWQWYDFPLNSFLYGHGSNAAMCHLPRQTWLLDERNIMWLGTLASCLLLFTCHAKPGGWMVAISNPSGQRTYESYLPFDQSTWVRIGVAIFNSSVESIPINSLIPDNPCPNYRKVLNTLQAFHTYGWFSTRCNWGLDLRYPSFDWL